MQLSQLLAFYLFEKGVQDQIYFDEIAKYAREAILARPPDVFAPGGDSVGAPRVMINPAFNRWCESRGLDFPACFRLMGTYRNSLIYLGGIRDSRATPILRDVLKMPDAGMVLLGVVGLAALNDSDSIPLIIQAGRRFPPEGAKAIAAGAIEYKDPRAEVIFDLFIDDAEDLAQVKREWRARIASQGAPEKN